MASQFKPSIAKAFYDYFGSVNVLDFSAGWGDRLAGFIVESTKSFVGIDPNSTNHPNYERQVEFYKKHQTFFEEEKEVELICSQQKMLIIPIMKTTSIQYLLHHHISMLKSIVMKTHKVTKDIRQSIVGIKTFYTKQLKS